MLHYRQIIVFVPRKEEGGTYGRDHPGNVQSFVGTYTTAQIDTAWTLAMMEDFEHWFHTDPRAAEFQHLNWNEEMEEARKRAEE